MTKVMLVEDDKSLREIYSVRLQAEGYEIVSAGDGEEALALAIKERPDLIVSDVMMPKISGFDMLDILRSTTETRDIKVIMMTALSSEEQRLRGEALGADKYLVKSQVGIEDVVRVVHEMLGDMPVAVPQTTAVASPVTTPNPSLTVPSVPERPPVPATQPARPQQPIPPVAPTPITPLAPVTLPPAQSQPQATPPTPPAPAQDARPTMPTVPQRQETPPVPQPPVVQPPSPTPVVQTQPPQTAPAPVPPQSSDTTQQQPQVVPAPQHTPTPPSVKSRVIQPLNDPSSQPIDIQQLLDKELAKEAGLEELERPVVQTAAQERQALEQELANFEAGNGQSLDANDTDQTTTTPPLPPPPPAAPNA